MLNVALEGLSRKVKSILKRKVDMKAKTKKGVYMWMG